MNKANYAIVKQTAELLVLRDLGPWDRYKTITNAVEEVIANLLDSGVLKAGQRLIYYDSDDQLDEIVIENNKFLKFQSLNGNDQPTI